MTPPFKTISRIHLHTDDTSTILDFIDSAKSDNYSFVVVVVVVVVFVLWSVNSVKLQSNFQT